MIARLKQRLFFPVAGYFKFWARLRLRRWHPQIVLITGSSGKTTLLHLLEAQIGQRAHYSHHANSAFGVPFDILGLHQDNGSLVDWVRLALAAPFMAMGPVRTERLYIVEADSDRPGEATFIADLVRPEVAVWLSSDRSHSAAFDRLVEAGQAPNVEVAIAHEYGHHLERATKLVVVDGDSERITAQLGRTKAKVARVDGTSITHYSVAAAGTRFTIDGHDYHIKALLPEEAGRSIAAVVIVCDYLGNQLDRDFAAFKLPPGRSSILRGVKNTTLIDSTYNAIPDAVRAILNLFDHFAAPTKWAVIGDMIEQGRSEQAEHERLADELAKLRLDRILLVGPRQQKYTAPRLKRSIAKGTVIETFLEPKEVLDYLEREIKGGETILFKAGSSFNLEGVVERLLANPKDADRLCRRGTMWERRRKARGL